MEYREKTVSLLSIPFVNSGLTGFDSGLECYVSTRRIFRCLLNHSEKKLIGENNNYALAA